METSDSDVSANHKRKIAYQVLRKNFPRLTRIPPKEVCDFLYSDGVISDQDYERTITEEVDSRDRMRKMMMKLQTVTQDDHTHFENFCDFLEESFDSPGLVEVGAKLKKAYTSGLESAEDRLSEEQQPIVKRGGTDYLKRLRQDISVIQKRIYQSDKNLDAKYSIIKESIQEYISTLLHTGSKEAEVESQLKVLCYEETLVPSKLHSWCFETLKALSQQLQPVQPTSDVLPQPLIQSASETPSLFSKDVVYHAMLLCNTVESSDETNYQQYLSKEPHEFEEVSISVLPTDKQSVEAIERCIIAKKKKMLYIAFRGEPSLSEWNNKYSSFLEGIEYQTKQIPVRFFAEQIREGFQIVLTGFSFGGLLAVSVATSIWQQTYITEAELTKNVICVGFGVPMISLPALSKTLIEYPNIESTIHLVYLKDDIIPRLMRFMNHQMVPSLPSVLALTSGDINQSQNSQFSSPIFECLCTLQNQTNFEPTPQEAFLQQGSLVSQVDEPHQSPLTTLKGLLGIVLSTNPPPATAQLPIFGVFQLIFTDVNGKLVMQDLASQATLAEFDFLSIQAVAQLTSQLFKQHYVNEYQIRLSRSYLERQRASYSPRFSRRHLPLVKILKPSVSSVAFYRHGDEIAMVLEGDNLWFCHQIEVPVSSSAKTHAIKTPAPDITRCSIQFNYKPICDDDFLVNLKAEDIQVTLFSHFSKPLRDQTALIVCKEGYEISLRQSQLAKHPPSELIELAYLCAMLEQPSSLKITKPTKRKQLITEFLENAVRIVPIESICHAITHCDEGIALKCVEAFSNSSVQFVPSLLFDVGCELAYTRIASRVTPDTIEQLEQQAMQNLQGSAPADRQHMYLPTVFRQDDKEISVTVSAFVGKKEKEIMLKEKQMSYSEAAAKGTKASPPTLSEESPFGLNLIMCSKTLELPKRRASTYKYTEEQYADLAERLHEMTVASHEVCAKLAGQNKLNVISGANIEELYPLKPKKRKPVTLKSPLKILTHARNEIFNLRKQAHKRLDDTDDESTAESSLENARMLEKINEIWQNDLKICASLLGAFMEQQIKVPLVQDSSLEMAKALYTTEAPAAVGIWSLFSLQMLDVKKMLDTAKGKTLLVQITDYIKSFCSEREDLPASDGRYAGKMQFLLQCLQNRVSCNSQYISYSLERQLATLCERYEIDPSTRVERLVQNWYRTFQGNILILVKPAYRPLLARWLIWSLAVHKLREGLASYTTVGVIGLVNSGKSKLIETLFNREVLTGTMELQRTTVPFMYNLDDVVEGLSVIDFPGVDDRDESIPGLAKLLLTLSQLVVLVVDYRKIHTESAKKWLDILDHESVPYLVCLTYADKLYANHLMKKHGINCPPSVAKREIGKELERVKEKLGRSPNRSMQFYSFSQDFDSSLSSDEGRQALQAAEIGCPRDVGDWIEGKLRGYLHLDDVASKLKHYLDETNA